MIYIDMMKIDELLQIFVHLRSSVRLEFRDFFFWNSFRTFLVCAMNPKLN